MWYLGYYNSNENMTNFGLNSPPNTSDSSVISPRLGRKEITSGSGSTSGKFVGAISYFIVWDTLGDCGISDQTR